MAVIHKLTECALPGEVNQDLVDTLKGLLERAERGEIVAMAWAHYSGQSNDIVGTGWEGAGGTLWALHSGVATLAHRFASNIIED